MWEIRFLGFKTKISVNQTRNIKGAQWSTEWILRESKHVDLWEKLLSRAEVENMWFLPVFWNSDGRHCCEISLFLDSLWTLLYILQILVNLLEGHVWHWMECLRGVTGESRTCWAKERIWKSGPKIKRLLNCFLLVLFVCACVSFYFSFSFHVRVYARVRATEVSSYFVPFQGS